MEETHRCLHSVVGERVVLDVQYMTHHSLFNVQNGTFIRLELSPILGQIHKSKTGALRPGASQREHTNGTP